MAEEVNPQIPAEGIARELFTQNLWAEAQEHGENWQVPTMTFDPAIRTGGLLPVQKLAYLDDYEKQCSHIAPETIWTHSPVKQLIDALRLEANQHLEGYEAARVNITHKPATTSLNPLDFPPIVTPDSITANQKRLRERE